MDVRYFVEDDYPMVCDWWKGWKWDAIPQFFLPKVGLIVSNGDVDICAAWIYRTDSSLCMFEFFISNPNAKKDKRSGAIEYLLEAMEAEARKYGYKAAFMSICNQSLIKKAKDAGFIGEETGMTNLTRIF